MNTSRGFAPLLVAIIIGLVIAGGIGYYAVSQKTASSVSVQTENTSVQSVDGTTNTNVQTSAQPTAQRNPLHLPPTTNSAAITISDVLTQSVAVQYKNIDSKAQLQIVNKSGARFDASSYVQTLVSDKNGSMTIA
jgi:primosomal protein N'